jgi:hypothetical protein
MRMRYTITLAIAALLAIAPALGAAVITFHAHCDGAQEPTPSLAQGTATVTFDDVSKQLSWTVTHNVANQTAAHFHQAPPGVPGPVVINIGVGQFQSGSIILSPELEVMLLGGLLYVNIHSQLFPGGEIRGQVLEVPTPTLASSWGRIKTLYR